MSTRTSCESSIWRSAASACCACCSGIARVAHDRNFVASSSSLNANGAWRRAVGTKRQAFVDELKLLQPTPGYMRVLKELVLRAWQRVR